MTVTEIRLRRETLSSSSASALILALNAELSARYPEDKTGDQFRLDAGEVADGRGAFLVAYEGGNPLGCGAIRLLDADTVEIKRMYVMPGARRRGFGRRLLEALEAEARILGAKRIVLETGPRQPEAIALYSSCGFSEIAAFGEHQASPLSVFMGKEV
jgi:putative acetyltransferase